MKKEDLYNSLNSIGPSQEQKSRMLRNILNHKSSVEKRKFRKPRLAIAIPLVCLMTSTVIAINIPSFQKLLEKIDPDVAEYIEPIGETSINNGIKVELIAASRYDNMVKAYIAFEDLESNRVGKDIELLDYYSIEGSNNFNFGSSSWSIVDYDETNNRIIGLVETERDTKYEGEDLIFKVDQIFYNSKNIDGFLTEINLNKINHSPSYTNSNIKSFATRSYGNLYLDKDLIPILKPNEVNINFPKIKTSKISNIGIINDKLHVQLWRDETVDGQGSNLYLVDTKGHELYADTEIIFAINKFGKMTSNIKDTTYKEYIFDINIDKLDEYQLAGYFVTRDQIDGPWEIAFSPGKGDSLEQNCNIDLDDMKIKNISINPFAIRIEGETMSEYNTSNVDLDKLGKVLDKKEVYETDYTNFNIKVNTDSGVIRDLGTNINWDSYYSSKEKDRDFILIYSFDKPIDINLIRSISINGKNIMFSN